MLMYSCKKATELIEIKQEKKISLTQGLRLRLHLMMCSYCKAYQKQSDLLSKALRMKTNSDKQVKDLEEKILTKLQS